MTKCRPHMWRVPRPEDDGLTCEACGRYLDFMDDITGNMRASICNAVKAREDIEGGVFVSRFDEAFEAAHGRRFGPRQPVQHQPLRGQIRQRKRLV